ncbi:sensor domain-containing protein [Halomonas elongata]|uniref:sensor domain-containing protein n=1 Tax=Halomonas elongata TaxID=2746 RepID=UPI0023AF9FF1|nr:EAL domain-containing protein [Halomonas elongata]
MKDSRVRSWRFSSAVLVLGVAFLTLTSAILLTAAYMGSEKALHEAMARTQERDQRRLDEVLAERFRAIRWQGLEVSGDPGLHRALRTQDMPAVSLALSEQLEGTHRHPVEALVVEQGDEFAAASRETDADVLREMVSDDASPQGVWRTVSRSGREGLDDWLTLALRISDTTSTAPIGRLHVFVRLNDNAWLADTLRRIFGALAVSMGRDGEPLLGSQQAEGQLAAMRDMDDPSPRPHATEAGVWREHRWRIDDSADYHVRSLLPDTATPALRETYLSTLLIAGLLVIVLGVVWMLVMRHLAGRALNNLVSYAKRVSEPGEPPAFRGGPFQEFNRVGRAFESMLQQAREQEKYLSGIIEHSPDLIFAKDTDGYHRLANRQYARALWTTPEALTGKCDEALLPEAVLGQARASDHEVFEGGEAVKYETTLRTPDGEQSFLVTKFPIGDDPESPRLVGGIATDITDLKETQERLGLVQRVFAETGEAIIVLDEQRRALIANRAFSEMSGYDQVHTTEAIRAFLFEHPEVANQLGRERRWQGQCIFAHREGGSLPVLVSVTCLRQSSGVAYHVLLFNDITELKLAEHRLEHLAWYDQLTGLPNRSLFALRLDEALQGVSTMTAVLFIDLDHFKDINDTHGHSLGDQLLCQVGERLRTCIQAKDLVSRFGGDEFTVLLRDIDSETQVMSIANRIMHTLGCPYELGEVECGSTASIGITLSMRHGGTAETLLRNADQAMYEAKAQGRQRIVLFEPDIDARHQQRLSYETGLREAIDKRELFVRYQPRFDISGRRVVGAEALVRWQSHEHGLVPPDTFIPIAEGTRLIVEIGRFVLGEACRQAAAWAEAGHAVPVSVNLSPRQLREESLWRDIRQVLRETGLSPRMLELELTETMLVDNIDRVLPLLQRIRAMGVRVAIDDFGTGYSSLTYLKRLPIDVVKIDRTFIVDVPGDRDDETLLEAIVGMARSLNYRVVAEGVESEEQRVFLETLGCDELQGFLLGRPEPPDKLLTRLGRSLRVAWGGR